MALRRKAPPAPAGPGPKPPDAVFLRAALRLARRAVGRTSPNPMVGAVLTRDNQILGCGWHHRAGEPHAEIEALRDAARRGADPRGATLYLTLEPCHTHGRTPPCTDAIIAAGIRRVVAGATDPNPRHCGRGFDVLAGAGVAVTRGVLEAACAALNEAFNHWIVHRTPFVIVKAAMTLDGKIATAGGESKWITSARSQAWAMCLRRAVDAVLVGVNTVLADNPSLTYRPHATSSFTPAWKRLRRIILDGRARTPLSSHLLSDDQRQLTTVVVGASAPPRRVAALGRRVEVLVAPAAFPRGEQPSRESPFSAIDLAWLLRELGAREITSLLVEGGGEAQASFLLGGFAQRIAFVYAPMILGGARSRHAVAGVGAAELREMRTLRNLRWRRLGPDLLLTAQVGPAPAALGEA